MDAGRAAQLLSEAREQTLAELRQAAPGDIENLADIDDDPAGRATEVTERMTDEALTEELSERLVAIERAQQRVAEGTYGRSLSSGEPIPDGRLEAIPWAEQTTAEAAGEGR